MIYRLKNPVENEMGFKPGQLVFTRSGMDRTKEGKIVLAEWANGQGRGLVVDPTDVEPAGDIKAPDFKVMLDYIFYGRAPVPNVEFVEEGDKLESALDSVASGGEYFRCLPGSRRALLPLPDVPEHARTIWCRVFVRITQGGAFDGTGSAILYRPKWGAKVPARVLTFAICKHEQKEGASANHQRGWHPAHCPKCGLDMTVDSGD